MRLLRYQQDGARICAVKGDGDVDLVAAGSRWMTICRIAAAGRTAMKDLRELVARADVAPPLASARLLRPSHDWEISRDRMNYARAETAADVFLQTGARLQSRRAIPASS